MGQNDEKVNRFIVADEQFSDYVERNRKVENLGIAVIPESNVDVR